MSRFSVKKRYAATLLTNLFNLLAGVVNSTVVPQTLGPVAYGSYQFLSRSFSSMLGSTNLGVSTAFFTASSRETRSTNALAALGAWLALQTVLLVLVVVGAVFFRLRSWLFPDQVGVYISLVALSEWLNYMGTSAMQFGESKAESVFVQRISLASSMLEMGVILALFRWNRLDLAAFILVNCLGGAFTASCVAWFFLRAENRETYFDRLSLAAIKDSARHFAAYCSPLAAYQAAGLFYNYFDRWFLMLAAGPVQQGLFSLSFQWCNVSMLFTGSMTSIAMRETSFSFGRGDFARLTTIYRRAFRLTVAIAGFLAVLLSFEARSLVAMFSGRFAAAAPIVRVMAFYPILAGIEALNASFFYGTEQIKVYRNIALVMMGAGVLITYILVAPARFPVPGCELGGIGVAGKMVLNSLLLVAAEVYFIARFLRLRIGDMAGDMLAVLLSLLSAGGAALLCERFVASQGILGLGVFVAAFSVGSVCIVWRWPERFGLRREDLRIRALLAGSAA